MDTYEEDYLLNVILGYSPKQIYVFKDDEIIVANGAWRRVDQTTRWKFYPDTE